MRRLLAAIVLSLVSASAFAAQTVVTDHARSRLAPAADGVAPGGVLDLAFAQQLQPGWHVYWKNPGDSGLPLEFVWTLPEGAVAGPIAYPAPHRIPIGPLVNFGHEGAPVFLTSIKAPGDAKPGDRLEIALDATWLICADICVPETGAFSLSVPVVAAPAANGEDAPLFEAARAAAPAAFTGSATYSVSGKTLTLQVEGAPAGEDFYFFPAVAVTEPAAAQKAARKGEILTLSIETGADIALAGDLLDGVLAYDAGGEHRALALSARRAAAPALGGAPGNAAKMPGASADRASAAGFLGFLAAAFIGGAILNLMPCVFPILFVKAASLADAAQAGRVRARRQGLLYGAGVLAAFAGLGGVLIALRAGGESIGWGFHLQSPAIVLLSAYVLFAVGLNLAGAFNAGSSLQNIGSGLASGGGDLAAFMTGVLAVFVAAPCVGPFLTAPIGAAAVLPPTSALMIFLAMGAGLALPFTALAFLPGLARLMPRPGAWMERLRQVLAFPVFAAAAFFIWVLAAQTGERGLALGLAGLIAIAFAARLFEWSRRDARIGFMRIAALLALALAAAPLFLARPAQAAPLAGEIAFDPADIAARRAAGEAVFIDFTAAWCVTCQFNKLTVFNEPLVEAALRDNDVTFVTADWTNRDRVIEAALAEFGANGVPLYVFYPRGGEPVVLAQPLTARAIIEAVSAPRLAQF